MSGKKNGQYAKVTKRKISSLCVLILFLLLFTYFMAFSIRNIIVCGNISTGNLKTYSGRFEICKARRTRNTLYFLSLENGDVVRIAPELLEDGIDLAQYSNLHFAYSAPKFGLAPAYTCIEITSIDGNRILLNDEVSKNEAKIGIYTGLFFTVLVVALIIPIAISWPLLSKVSYLLKQRNK